MKIKIPMIIIWTISEGQEEFPMPAKYDVAAYVWPSYKGECQTVKNAVKQFPEHNCPRKPI